MRKLLLTLCCVLSATAMYAQTWTALTNLAPDYNGGVMLLLTDGTVICKTFSGTGGSGTYGTTWDKLTPDSHGSYLNGTWSTIANMHDDRLYFSTQILKDGRVYVAGGEYGSGGPKGEVYDPILNSWTMTPSVTAVDTFYDANSEILPNGKVLQAVVIGDPLRNYIYNPVANTYAISGSSSLGIHDESPWVKLPDESILVVDLYSYHTGHYFMSSERYIPSTDTWVADAEVPDSLYDPYGYEAGAGFLLPNGKAFFLGASGHTAYYTPSGTTSPGTWAAGPDIPSGQGTPDASAAMMVNGKILCSVSPKPTSGDHFPTPTAFYVFDYTTNTFTLVSAPGGGSSLSQSCYQTNMLDLPDGTVLYASQNSQQYYEFNPGGTPLSAGKPTINNVIANTCTSFTITGTLFNGITEGAAYGDDWQMSTNYPIVRLTSGTNVYYARTTNWNRTDVMTGSALDTAQFTLPSGLPIGTYALQVVVNGNASSNYTFSTIPAFILPGSATVCTGNTINLTDATSGGTWTSNNAGIASVGSATGVVLGIATGTTVISYSFSGGCYSTAVVTVNASPNAGTITGTATVCVGAATHLTDATSGGTWSSTNTGVGTVEGTGIVTGIAAGTTTISYTATNGCGGAAATRVVTVNPLANAGTITGTTAVCVGATTTLTDAATGGTWSSITTGIATVGSTGLVTGMSSGTDIISYTVTNGCGSVAATTMIAVNALPAVITGIFTVSATSITSLMDPTTGGTWSSSNTAIGTVDGSGNVYGIAAGTTTITYTLSTGCYTTAVITVYSTGISPITGTISICSIGGTTLLSDATTGGTWSSTNASVGTVDPSSGIVTGISIGTTLISYTTSGGTATAIVTVNSMPTAAPTNNSPVCYGGAVMLSANATGTTNFSWSGPNLSSTTIANPTATPTASCTYSLTVSNSGCSLSTTTSVVVNPTPTAAPTNNGPICGGGTVGLFANASGSTNYSWSGPNLSSVTALNPIATPTATAIYSLTVSSGSGSGCSPSTIYTTTVAVESSADSGSIIGVATVCTGSTTNLTDAAFFGVWSSGSTGTATVGTNGVVTGVAAGTALISYTVTNACGSASAIDVVTVNSTVSAGTITGPSAVSAGSNITLTDAAGGGVWSASNANATVTGGVVTGVTAGTVTISYTVTGGCGPVVATKVITVSTASLPGINGNTTICASTTTTLTDASTGGTWSSSNGAVATIGGTTGIVTGLAAGTTNITYTQGGTSTTIILTVNAIPLPIQGATSACAGTMITLTDNTSGGTWSSTGDVSVVTAGTNSGTVTEGATAGIGTITYTLSDGCYMTYPNTALAGPSAIFGVTTVCVGSTTVLSDTTLTAVSWTSSNTLVATVAITGHVTGVAGGAVTITYKASSGCIATTMVSVTSTPGAITGNGPVCAGSAITLGDVSGAGTWSSSNAAIATVGTASGVVTGVAAGTATVTYFPNAGGCKATATVTVNAILPITGSTSVCAGGITTLYDASAGGTWISGNSGVATIALSTGVVTGVATGSTLITYTLASGCTRTTTVNVAGSMSPIAGPTSLCASATATLSDASSGTWSSSNTLLASIGTSGLVTASAVNTGTVTISYSGSGCVATVVLTVNANPLPVQGAISECAGTIVTLTDNTSGGTWSITGDASISGTGVLTAGAVAGTATVTYTVGSCSITYPNTVIKNPSAIFGALTVCAGSVTILSDSSATGVSWTSSNTLAATVAATGHVTGIAFGTAIITYKALPGNCIATAIVTVNAVPAITPITGPTSIAEGTPATLTEATSSGVWSSSNTSKITLSGSTGLTVTATAVALSGSSVISYVVTNGFGCSATATLTIASTSPPPPHTTGMTTPDLAQGAVTLYPNPTNGTINIRADVAGIFNLYSIDGRTLGAYKISEGITNMTLPNDLATGIYMGKYVGEDGNVVLFKIVKE